MHKSKTLILIIVAVLAVFYSSRAVLLTLWSQAPPTPTTSVVNVEQPTQTASVAESQAVQRYESVEASSEFFDPKRFGFTGPQLLPVPNLNPNQSSCHLAPNAR